MRKLKRKFDWNGHLWTVVFVKPKEFMEPEDGTFVELDDERLIMRILDSLCTERIEEYLIHEVIEEALYNCGILDILIQKLSEGKKLEIDKQELADWFSDALEKHIYGIIRKNKEFFPSLTNVESVYPKYLKDNKYNVLKKK